MSSIIIRDAEVYDYHLETLNKFSWVSDMIIHAHGIILEEESKDFFPILFFPPCTVQFFRFSDEEIVKNIIPYWNPFNYEIIFLPMSDGTSFEDTGSHWTLIVWKPSKSINIFYHFDSMKSGTNENLINFTVEKFSKLYCLNEFEIKYIDCPQQTNGFDCGVYLMTYEEHLIKFKGEYESMNEYINPEFITQNREKIKNLIKNYKK